MEHGSIITQARREDALVLTKQGLVSKSSPKKPRGRNIFKALFCCFHTQHVGQSSPSTELTYKEETNTIAKSDLLQCLQYQFYQIPGTCLLPEVTEQDQGRICVVIDLDETLVHSSFKPINNADFIVPVEIEGTTHQVYVLKRPYVDEFLRRMGELFECVLFTASLAKASFVLPVCRPRDRPPRPVWGVPGPPVPGVLCVPPGLLRQGSQPPGQGPEEDPHPGQLTCVLHLPPGECSARAVLV
ncbi:carboxy-terminal domain RNA polymerase II polypeptide A small phosphatase 2 isoform X2 [Mesocricetus auratus]|uniref:Mitochondrial import inner membrane translocase subunit TIM50 n=1 Tax=Mesocricetus auratus TaxID=10036 RepID=A0ABM2Y9I3_MESAU|nr:carboxy-terminal domain RNA polymerase II polypeptide A small phosphatase 2 isoform X2 [Mesocricetus auratus]